MINRWERLDTARNWAAIAELSFFLAVLARLCLSGESTKFKLTHYRFRLQLDMRTPPTPMLQQISAARVAVDYRAGPSV